MMSKATIWLIFVYGLIIMTLGCFGYGHGKSLPSLLAGLLLGGALVTSATAMFAGHKMGSYVSLIATALLTVVFAYRYALTGKGTPGFLAILSAGMLLYLLSRFGKWKRL